MKKNTTVVASVLLAMTAFLGACQTPQTTSQTYPASTQATATSYGVVDSIQAVNTQSNRSGIGVGTVAGGVVGGLLGNQVGGGSGKTAATAAGVVGGAIVGNQIENRNKAQTTAYQVGVRLDNGSFQSVTQDSVADLSIGSRVRIENGHVYRY
jgi:outer membrane lipoprotein SlyB